MTAAKPFKNPIQSAKGCDCVNLDGGMKFRTPRVLDAMLGPEPLLVHGRPFEDHRVVQLGFCRTFL